MKVNRKIAAARAREERARRALSVAEAALAATEPRACGELVNGAVARRDLLVRALVGDVDTVGLRSEYTIAVAETKRAERR